MPMKITSLFIILCLSISANAQQLKKVKNKTKEGFTETYTVLKSDRSIRHGSYSITDGKISYVRGQYENNLKVGNWTYSENYSTIKGLDGTMEYYEKGELIWTKGWSNSKYSTLYYNRTMELDSVVFFNGNMRKSEVYRHDSIFILKYTTDKKVRISGALIGEKAVGEWRYKFQESTAVLQFTNGIQTGQQTSYFLNGNIQASYVLNDSGKREGNYLRFFENGDSFVQIGYQNNKYHGRCRIWHSTGELFIDAYYEHGRLIQRKVYDENGKWLTDSFENGNGTIFLYKMRMRDNITAVDPSEAYAKANIVNGYYHGEYIDLEHDTTYMYVAGVLQGGEKQESDTGIVTFYRLIITGHGNNLGFGGSGNFEKEFVQFMLTNIHYPRSAQEAEIEGQVMIQFTVDATGEISDIEVLSKKLGYGLDEAAMEIVIISSNFWIPACTAGIPRDQKFTLPVQYRLY